MTQTFCFPVFCLTLVQCWRMKHALWLLEKIFFTNTPPLTIKDHSEMSFSPTIPLQPSYRRINTTLKLSLTLCLTPNVLPAPGMIHAPALVALTLALFPQIATSYTHTHTFAESVHHRFLTQWICCAVLDHVWSLVSTFNHRKTDWLPGGAPA